MNDLIHPLYWRLVCEALTNGARVELVEVDDGRFFRVNYEDDPDTRPFLVPLRTTAQEFRWSEPMEPAPDTSWVHEEPEHVPWWKRMLHGEHTQTGRRD